MGEMGGGRLADTTQQCVCNVIRAWPLSPMPTTTLHCRISTPDNFTVETQDKPLVVCAPAHFSRNGWLAHIIGFGTRGQPVRPSPSSPGPTLPATQ